MNENGKANAKQVGRAQLNEATFQQIPNILINELAAGKLMPIDIPVYIILLDHVRDNPWCYPSLETIGRLCGCNKRTISRSLGRLEDAGHIMRKGKSRHGTRLTWVHTRVRNEKIEDGRKGMASRASRKSLGDFPLPDRDAERDHKEENDRVIEAEDTEEAAPLGEEKFGGDDFRDAIFPEAEPDEGADEEWF